MLLVFLLTPRIDRLKAFEEGFVILTVQFYYLTSLWAVLVAYVAALLTGPALSQKA